MNYYYFNGSVRKCIMKVYKGDPNLILGFQECFFPHKGTPLLYLLGFPSSVATGWQVAFCDPALKVRLPHFCHSLG